MYTVFTHWSSHHAVWCVQTHVSTHVSTHAHTHAYIYCAHIYTHRILYHVTKLTRIPHSRIFQVHTVVDTPSSTQALSHVGLCTKAVDIIQPDGLIGATSSKVGIGKGNCGPREAQLMAYHLGILYSPEVITHGPPGVFVVHSPPEGRCLPPAWPAHCSLEWLCLEEEKKVKGSRSRMVKEEGKGQGRYLKERGKVKEADCGDDVWGWDGGMRCGDEVWRWGVGMRCGDEVWGWCVGMRCGDEVWNEVWGRAKLMRETWRSHMIISTTNVSTDSSSAAYKTITTTAHTVYTCNPLYHTAHVQYTYTHTHTHTHIHTYTHTHTHIEQCTVNACIHQHACSVITASYVHTGQTSKYM